MLDWGAGRYEETARELEPVAAHVVALANLSPGERVLDLACGTGNAALEAARAGGVVTGLDGAARLVEVARGRAQQEGLDAEFVIGDVQALPFDASTYDAALSVFGLIFAADAEAAFAEMIRVLRPGGRALISVWVPSGPIDAMVGVFARAIAEATGMRQRRFPWNDRDAVDELAGRHHAEVHAHDGELRIVAASPEAYLDASQEHHPMSVAARPLLERAGNAERVRERALAVLHDGNEDPHGFRVTSPYRVLELRRRDA